MKGSAQNLVETSSGKLVKYKASYEGNDLVLNMTQHIVSRTSARTVDYMAVKSVDESYNEYQFIISTGVEPWSKYISKRVIKQAKRNAKGKKKQSVEELM